jgi:beta-mannosidase
MHLILLEYILANHDFRIPDTSHGMNEHEAIWVDESSWSYKCTFPTSSTAQQSGARIALVLEGLDTFATVKLNGIVIVSSDNMFIRHKVDITAHISSNLQATNILQIDFDSALVRGREIIKEHPEHAFNHRQGGVERLGVRKAQYHWGWDWGPKYMTAGPWRPVRLETYCSRVDDLSVEYNLAEDFVSCGGVISVRVDGFGRQQVCLILRDSREQLVFQTDSEVSANGLVQAPFSFQNPELWYPHGYGSQPLYTLACELIAGGNVVQTLTKKIGFRTVELIQEPDPFGKSFYFRINGIDVFAGGSCWIPADNFIPRISPEKYRAWMELMVESNQIMTR